MSSAAGASPDRSARSDTDKTAAGSTNTVSAAGALVHLSRRVVLSIGRRLHAPGNDDAADLATYGKPARAHGHDLELTVTVVGPLDPRTGMVLNFDDLKREVSARVLAEFDEAQVDIEVDELKSAPATLENLARVVRKRLESDDGTASSWLPSGCRVEAIKLAIGKEVWVTDRIARPAGQGGARELATEFTRNYGFSASHRLCDPTLSDDENRKLFGKCASANGHGHNYRLEVTIAGAPDARTGRVVDGRALDRVVEESVLELLDHTYLNLDRPELFDGAIPTAENIARVIWRLLATPLAALPARLAKIRLEETRDCHVEIYADRLATDPRADL